MSDQARYHPEEFFPVLDQLPKGGGVVICGGQAVNLLAAVFLSERQIKEILGSDGSATSGDMDIMITQSLQAKLSEVEKIPRISRPVVCRLPTTYPIRDLVR